MSARTTKSPAAAGFGVAGAKPAGRAQPSNGRADAARAKDLGRTTTAEVSGDGRTIDLTTPVPVSVDERQLPVLAVVEAERSLVRLTPWLLARLSALVIVLLVLGATAGFLVAGRGTKVYGARAEVEYQLTSSDPASFLRDDRKLLTQVETIKSRAVLEPVATEKHISLDELTKSVDASVVANSEILRIQVKNQSPDRAKDLLQSVVNNYLDVARSTTQSNETAYLQNQLNILDGQRQKIDARLSVLQGARIPAGPTPAVIPPPTAEEVQLAAESQNLLDQRKDVAALLHTETVKGFGDSKVDQIDQPYVLPKPLSPRPELAAAGGAVAALPVGIVLAAYLARRRSARQTRR